MKVNKEYIAELLEKYFDGITSLKEEQTLREYFKNDDIPDEWADYKHIFAFFDMSINLSEEHQAKSSKSKIKKLILYITSISVAACVALLVGVHIFKPKDNQFLETSHAFINGKSVVDLRIIQTEVLKTLNNMEESNDIVYSSQLESLELFFDVTPQ
ncbi:hypothetical protein M2138_000616 [Dysgonomonadaceae bacterium PH5-43]|nr:hypothetical protein [Dysgonomonadaceae bacterium PH5-43]